jgi:hypothetical protein
VWATHAVVGPPASHHPLTPAPCVSEFLPQFAARAPLLTPPALCRAILRRACHAKTLPCPAQPPTHALAVRPFRGGLRHSPPSSLRLPQHAPARQLLFPNPRRLPASAPAPCFASITCTQAPVRPHHAKPPHDWSPSACQLCHVLAGNLGPPGCDKLPAAHLPSPLRRRDARTKTCQQSSHSMEPPASRARLGAIGPCPCMRSVQRSPLPHVQTTAQGQSRAAGRRFHSLAASRYCRSNHARIICSASMRVSQHLCTPTCKSSRIAPCAPTIKRGALATCTPLADHLPLLS